MTLTKARLSTLVAVTTVCGYFAALRGGGGGAENAAFSFWTLAHTLFGTLLAAFGAAVFNQVMEIDAEKSKVGPEDEGVVVTVVEGREVRSPIIDVTTAQTTVSASSGETLAVPPSISITTTLRQRSGASAWQQFCDRLEHTYLERPSGAASRQHERCFHLILRSIHGAETISYGGRCAFVLYC